MSTSATTARGNYTDQSSNSVSLLNVRPDPESNWQKKLLEKCSSFRADPQFGVVSDRRGGRTAWSAWVKIHGQEYKARYWYDGNYINNAFEDVAEVAFNHLKQQAPSRFGY